MPACKLCGNRRMVRLFRIVGGSVGTLTREETCPLCKGADGTHSTDPGPDAEGPAAGACVELPPYSPPKTAKEKELEQFNCQWCLDTRQERVPADLSPDGEEKIVPCHHCTEDWTIAFPSRVLNAKSLNEVPLEIDREVDEPKIPPAGDKTTL